MDGERASAWADLSRLPPKTRGLLLLGGTGRTHLLEAGRAALVEAETHGPEASALGLDLFLAAFESSPLDGGLARFVMDLWSRAGTGGMSAVPKKTAALVMASAVRAAPPDDPAALGELARLAGLRDHQGLLAYLAGRVRTQPQRLYWRGHLFDVAYLLQDWETVRTVLGMSWPPGFELVRAKVAGDLLFQAGRYDEAATRYARAAPLRQALWRRAECLTRRDGPLVSPDARAAWQAVLCAAPWNVGPVLRLHDRLAGCDRPGPPLAARVAVCLYTYNNAVELDASLAALFASDLCGARVTVLDNGSGGATADVLSGWRDRIGDGLSVVTLPVNIGAPAARNWLAALPWIAEADYVAYLDDDALVPPDWLAFFASAARIYPMAGVYGCRVVDLAGPGRVQHADTHLLEPGQDGMPAVSSICTQDLDFGQFCHLRPAASVTGCCHLFRTGALRACGPFDIRFSPTQYDDLDHDLRLLALGAPPVYQGHLRVSHARLSTTFSSPDRTAMANSQGNLVKLGGKHPPEVLSAMRRAMRDVLLEDYRRKRSVVDQALGQARES
ncbi:glycosyltransferase family 2 protein [Desulfolutivibrio sulfoxidireducens]|uniref:glycosyltransferase family 2 protein n=1 Tax=Desulfolutivibrio sulfoxidireducens TaxID=2773299 RepID=UPI00159E43CB|nr:glycosyltransferase family A protein [Desulfolutivibrio sulfoxidireducens]QLA16035.1 glycosyltransferase [Desulfolutivibrio sulfoxidireducens]